MVDLTSKVVVGFCFAIGVALVVSGVPLWMKRIRPNGAYGVRTASTMADETVWYEINRAGGKHLCTIGVAFIVAFGLTLRFAPTWPFIAQILVPLGALTTALSVDAIWLTTAADRLLRQIRGTSHPDRIH